MTVDISASPAGALPARDPIALQALVDLLYGELRKLAHRERFRLGAGATLCTTALVSEAWLKLQKNAGWQNHQHFLGTAALAMRQVLVNDVVARRAEKRDPGHPLLPLNDALDAPDETDDQILFVNDAVEKLATLSPRLAQVVECRYFAGFSDDETAQALGLTARTVRRDWAKARAWLFTELGEGAAGRGPLPQE
ncbi:ECF-type sigma factor [Arenimonas sp.]|uniref:ECF-type sigma factor n=1 Tax=Arenimonas sp. TaxID=1872635 RepID=UPI0035B10F89